VEPAIRDWLTRVALPGERVAGVRALTGGYSNENLLVTTAGGDAYVLRRYLRNNTCAVEAALAARLAGIVPVAQVVAADPDRAVLLSAFVPGQPVSEVLTGETAAELGRVIGDVLARIGSVSFPAPGFFTGDGLEPAGGEPIGGLVAYVDRCLREGNAAGHLTAGEQRQLRRLAARAETRLVVLRGSRRLVHSDFNPKNLLVAQRDGRWRMAAVLDWEFAFSSSPLFDVGNMLRDPRPAGFAESFVAGFRAGGGELPPDWRRLSQALDLYALAEFLTRPVGHRYFGKAVRRIRELVHP
jgi:Ser/Thr protein kinase RdoA (MazF antagonist)